MTTGERQPTPDELGFYPDPYGGRTGWRLDARDDAGVELSTRRHDDGMLELDEGYCGTDHDLTLFPDAAAMACYLWREYPELFPDAEPWDTLPDGRRRELRWTRRGIFSVAAVGD